MVILLVVLAVAFLGGGCIISWQGRPLLQVDPDASIWVRHPETTNGWSQP